MTEKQTILGRIAQLTRANINALIDRAEDPEKMLDQLIRDYSNNIVEAEGAIAQTIGNLRLAEQDQEADRAAAQEWGAKARGRVLARRPAPDPGRHRGRRQVRQPRQGRPRQADRLRERGQATPSR